MTSGTCSASGIPSPGWLSSVPQGLEAVSVVVCRSAIFICLRMKDRSPAVTVNPPPTGAGAALAPCTATVDSPTPITNAVSAAP